MKTNRTILAALASFGIIAALAVPALAAPAPKAAAKAAVQTQAVQSKSAGAIDSRVENLNKLLARIQEMKNLPATEKASVQSEIQTLVSDLTTLKAKIAVDTSTTTLKADSKSITASYRIYALVMPQITITATADRIMTIVGMLTTIETKLQARLASGTSTVSASTQAKLSDMSVKLGDAQTQATAAVNGVSGLRPDNGDKAVLASNQSVLKTARTQIEASRQAVLAARKDAVDVRNIIMGTDKTAAKAAK